VNRRGFLRGAFAVLGAAAAGLPAVEALKPTAAEISSYTAVLRSLYPAERLPTLLLAQNPFWSMLSKPRGWSTTEDSYAPFCRVRRSLVDGGWIEGEP
jgi:hypothetical protein